jgi:DNA-binding NtrC family response regulator
MLHSTTFVRIMRMDSEGSRDELVAMAQHDPSSSPNDFQTSAATTSPVSLAWKAPPSRAPSDDDIEPLRSARRNAMTAFELKYLEKVLSRSQGSIARAAALSKVSRQMLQKMMRKHGVSMPR